MLDEQTTLHSGLTERENSFNSVASQNSRSDVPKEILAQYRIIFHSMDVDGDGHISVAEMVRAFGLPIEQCRELLKRGDTNNDSKLDFDEFVRLMTDKDTPLPKTVLDQGS